MKKNIMRKTTVLILSLLMCLTFMPAYAFADDAPAAEETETVVSEVSDDIETAETEEAIPEEEAVPEGVPPEEDASDEEALDEVAAGTEIIEDELDLSLEPSDNGRAAANAQGVVVEATDSSIILHIGSVGSHGTAYIFSYTPESYHHEDPYKGVSKNIDTGVIVAEYTLGTQADIELDRYTDGADHLYDKYYLIAADKIIAGPFYASEIAPIDNKNVTSFEMKTKKGLTHENSTPIEKVLEFGTSNTVINCNLGGMVYANEDKNGNPIDNSGKNAIQFVSNGETFYFDANYVYSKDNQISQYTKNGINVTMVVITWANSLGSSYPSSLKYDTNGTDRQTLGFNTSNALGRKYWVAAMEFMAQRYSDKDFAFVDQYIVGNEIDFTYDWYLIQPGTNAAGAYQRADFDTFMEEYARTLRLAELAVKKYNSGSKVLVSLTHNWAENSFEGYGWGSGDTMSNKETLRVNSYAPKKIVDWLVKQEGARGNYNWGLSVHPYPIITTSSNPIKADLKPSGGAHPITGNADTSPWITAANLELYQQYLDRPVNQYKGETRTVSITEGSICNEDRSTVSREEYEKSTMEQAASIAMMYYRAACIPCINEIAYFEYHDQNTGGSYQLGLAEEDGTEKPAALVWKYIDTDKSFDFSGRYLKYIDPDAGSYKDVMKVTKSGFNWDKYWTDNNLMPRDTDPAQTDSTEIARIFGSSRYETSIKSADALKKQLGVDKFDSVILACGTNFADALAGSYLASVRQAPILLVRNRSTEIKPVQDYIKKNLREGGTIYMLGGEAVVPPAAVAGLEGYKINRLGGSDRYDTNVKILKEAAKYADEETVYLVASGTGFADSLSASAAGKPIILVRNQIMPSQKDFIKSLKGKKFYIIGGTGAVNENVEKEFKSLGKTGRIGGATRYETSANVARTFFENPSSAVLAYGANFPDGLCGGPLAYAMGGPLILAANGRANAAITYSDAAGIYSGKILGGPTLISDGYAKLIFGMPSDGAIK